MPHDLSHLGFLAGQIGRLISISTTPVIAGDSFEMDAVGALRLSPLRGGLAIDSTVDIFTFDVCDPHVYGEQWIKFMKDGVNDTPLPTVNTTGYIDLSKYNVDDVALGVCKTGAEEAGVTEVRTSLSEKKFELWREIKVGRAVQQECRDRSRMPSSA